MFLADTKDKKELKTVHPHAIYYCNKTQKKKKQVNVLKFEEHFSCLFVWETGSKPLPNRLERYQNGSERSNRKYTKLPTFPNWFSLRSTGISKAEAAQALGDTNMLQYVLSLRNAIISS